MGGEKAEGLGNDSEAARDETKDARYESDGDGCREEWRCEGGYKGGERGGREIWE